nr:MAG: hypothetical protein [Microvirus sp.]
MSTKEKMKAKEKMKELEKLRKIPENKLTDEQKERIEELVKELAKVVLTWLLERLTENR